MSFVAVIAGARPNFMKADPVLRALAAKGIASKLIHTGQHYDKNMSDVFFQELGIPEPDVNLGVGSGTHAEQTAEVMVAYEKFCFEQKPAWTLVVGDVNSTVACSLVSAKLGIPVCHVEAGLRSRDWTMPEEVNRVVTDRLSDLLFTPSPDGDDNLLKEGVPKERIHFVGNVMIDTLFRLLPKARESKVLDDLGVKAGEFVLVTMHRPANVDDEETLSRLVSVFVEISERIPLVLPLHPRARKQAEAFGLLSKLESAEGIKISQPVGYIDCLALSSSARFVLTDSGGLQEETTALGVPCLTIRENTERPVTVTDGTNEVVGTSKEKILSGVERILSSDNSEKKCPALWDGKAAERTAEIIAQNFEAC